MGPPAFSVLCPPNKSIATGTSDVYSALKVHVDNIALFEDICKLVELNVRLSFHEIRRRVLADFLPFSCGALNTVPQQKRGKKILISTLELQEKRFVESIVDLLRLSYFQPLTADEWDRAQQDNFLLDMPVDVNWQALDDELLRSFWESNAELKKERSQLPEAADRVLVFHRGIGLATKKDRFLTQKIDLLVDYIVLGPTKKLYKRIMRKPEAPPPVATTMIPRSSSTHKYERRVARKTLKMALPSALEVLKSLLSEVEIHEPEFTDLVVVYRQRVKEAPTPKHAIHLEPTKEEKLAKKLRKRNIYIKSFRNIAMADVEMVFPEKKVALRPLALVQLLVTVGVAIIMALVAFWRASDAMNLNAVWSILSLLVAKCAQSYTAMMQEKANLEREMSQSLYDKTKGCQDAVLFSLLEDMSEQQVKQALLAYVLSLKEQKTTSKALTQEEMDDMCESWLAATFEEKIDFDISSSLQRLQNMGIMRRAGPDGFLAVPLEDARKALEEALAQVFREMGKDNPSDVSISTSLKGGMTDASRSVTSGAKKAGAQIKGAFTRVVSMGPFGGDRGPGSPSPEITSSSQENINGTSGSFLVRSTSQRESQYSPTGPDDASSICSEVADPTRLERRSRGLFSRIKKLSKKKSEGVQTL